MCVNLPNVGERSRSSFAFDGLKSTGAYIHQGELYCRMTVPERRAFGGPGCPLQKYSLNHCFCHRLWKASELFPSQRSLPYFSWNPSSESERDEIQNTFSNSRSPLSAGLLSERRAAQGRFVWRNRVLLACPRKWQIHCWEGFAIAYNHVAQYSGYYACNENQKLSHLLFYQQTLSAFRSDIFPKLTQENITLPARMH